MRDVARAHDVQALASGPDGQVGDVQLLAGGSGIMGMNMEIGNQAHKDKKNE
jgi:hypothetical protein